MSNITTVFKVALLLDQGQDLERAFEEFFKVGTYTKAEGWHLVRENKWDLCSHSNHLICKSEFTSYENAKKAEEEAFDILSELGYWKDTCYECGAEVSTLDLDHRQLCNDNHNGCASAQDEADSLEDQEWGD